MSTCLRMSALFWVIAVAGCGTPSKDSVAASVPEAAQPGPQENAQVEIVPVQRDGETVVVVGQRLEIALDGNPSTGYMWEIEADGAPALAPVPLLAAPRAPAAPETRPVVGSPVLHRWHFEAVQPGTTSVRLVYRRSWEKDVAPIRDAEFRVKVEAAPGS